MPLMVRSSTGTHGRVTKVPFHEEKDDLSRSDSRRTGSRRDASPRSHHYRSTPTPDSRPSSRTSVSDSGSETDATASTQEEKKVDLIPDKAALKERMSGKRGHDRDRRRETVVYEEDMDRDRRRSRRKASPERQRASPERRRASPERPSSPRPSPETERHHRHSSQRTYRRHASPDEERKTRTSSKRSSKKYYESEAPVAYDRPPSLRRSHTVTGSHAASSHSASSSRRSSILGNFLRLPAEPAVPERPARPVTCVVCMDELPSTKTAKLKCNHRMCNSCLKRSFKLSTTDPQHMPPKCCSEDVIPLKHVEKLFDNHFKKTWNKKFREFSTRNRIYCPSRRCGEWIKPENIYREDDRKGGRKVARCGRCRTKVCCTCNGRWHASRECPQDEETNMFLEQAKQEGWQRCHRCKAMVELKEGCNHMTCRCGAEFCMICGTKWKNCECPWFNFDAVEADRLEHMQVPFQPRPGPFEPDQLPTTRDVGPRAGMGVGMRAAARPQTYQEELISRRLQEQLDADLARRLQALDSFDGRHEGRHDVRLDSRHDDYRGDIANVVGLGNQAGHFMNDDYRRRPENILVPPPPPPPAPPAPPMRHPELPPPPGHGSPFERQNPGADYVSGVNRARGVRASSLERRLADRFSTDHRTSPGHRPTAPPPPPMAQGMPMMSGMSGMPLAPAPPPAVPPGVSLSRRHTMEDSLYNNPRSTRSPDRIVVSGRKPRRSYDAEPPSSDRRRRKDEPVRMSTLAGLGGPGRGMNRVYEWAAHVEPGEPEDEEAAAAAAAPPPKAPPAPTVTEED